jgi:hypothetical protein
MRERISALEERVLAHEDQIAALQQSLAAALAGVMTCKECSIRVPADPRQKLCTAVAQLRGEITARSPPSYRRRFLSWRS